ncbi:copper chaperone PCu(A)C [Marinobacter sp. VGCF2001]|uniref:copper chaperone PCu(A)C n=1 Tax=Marinobacter sp. VGCF2001 TaxID=3417189 RepID=UPI003CF0F6F4
MKQCLIPLAIVSALVTPTAFAGDHGHQETHLPHPVQIDQPWSRPTPPGTPMGVGYMSLTNSGEQAIVLVGAESPRAEHISIHETSMHEGMMRMQPVDGGLEIPPGMTVELKPHSYHLMLEQLPRPLAEGEKIPVRLDFDGAEDLDVELTVRALDGAPAMGDHSGMKH